MRNKRAPNLIHVARPGPKQQGIALIELIVAISLMAILAVYANKERADANLENISRGGGTYIHAVTRALEEQLMQRFPVYALNPVPIDPVTGVTMVSGFANNARPTLAELIAAGRLRAGFPTVMPTRQVVRMDVTTTGCPGAACQVTGTVCTTTAVTYGSADPRYDLVTAMYEEQRGRGGMSLQTSPGTINGPTIAIANPNGAVAGVVCGTTFLDFSLYNAFVRVRDTRDPDLQGNLTVAGNTTLNGPTAINNTLNVTGATTLQNNLTVNGSATVGPCINLAGGAQGRAGFGCANPNDVPAGMAGGVRSVDVVAQGTVLASDNPGAFTGANGNYAIVTANNGAGVAEMRTSGRAAADRLTPLGQFASGAACDAADEGSIARLAGGPGLVACTLGFWRVFTFQAAANDACAPNGATARDASGRTLVCMVNLAGGNNQFVPFDELFRTGTVNTACTVPGATAVDRANNNETLLCRINLAGGTARWMRLRDITSHLVFVRSEEVTPGATVLKPVCNGAGGGNSPVEVIQLIPKVWSSPDGGQAFFATNNANSWTVSLRDGTGANLVGNPNAAAIAQVYCYFP